MVYQIMFLDYDPVIELWATNEQAEMRAEMLAPKYGSYTIDAIQVLG